jgi:hypothetical protein
MLQPMITRPVYLGVGPRSGPYYRFFSTVWQLRVSSLMRGRMCSLLVNCFWALPAPTLSEPNPTELKALCYCLIWDSPNVEDQVLVFVSPPPAEYVGPIKPPKIGLPFRHPLQHVGLWWRYSKPPAHEVARLQGMRLIYDRRSVGCCVLVSGTHPGLMTIF